MCLCWWQKGKIFHMYDEQVVVEIASMEGLIWDPILIPTPTHVKNKRNYIFMSQLHFKIHKQVKWTAKTYDHPDPIASQTQIWTNTDKNAYQKSLNSYASKVKS